MKILNNKVGIVTGAAGFMGIQHVNAILNNGGKVVAIDVDKKKLNQLKKKIKNEKKKNIIFLRGDISNEKFVYKSLKIIIKTFKNLDILVNNAAINYSPKNNNKKLKLENFDISHFKNDLSVSLVGALICTKIFGGHMSKKNGGVILNIASDLSLISPDNRVYNKKNKLNFVKPISYSISKHGLIGLTKYTATYWAKKKIRCNAFAPGGIYDSQDKSFIKKISNLIPLGRLSNPGEYEKTILYLISDASSYMTGSTLVLDGGRTSW